MFQNWFYLWDRSNEYHKAVSQNDEASLHNLMGNGHDGLDEKDSRGRTPLSIAIEQRNSGIMQFLLKIGATHDHRHYDKCRGPLHVAARLGYYEGVKVLIYADANVNATDESGNIPLHSVASLKKRDDVDERMKILKILLESGSEKNSKNKSGKTPLHLAIENEQTEIASALLDAGVDARIADANLQTPLHLCVLGRQVVLCQRLIGQRVDVNAVDSRGLSALNYAEESSNQEMIALFPRTSGWLSFSSRHRSQYSRTASESSWTREASYSLRWGRSR